MTERKDTSGVRLTRETHYNLRLLATRMRTSNARVIERALRLLLRERGEEWEEPKEAIP